MGLGSARVVMIDSATAVSLTIDAGTLEDLAGFAAWSQAIAFDLD